MNKLSFIILRHVSCKEQNIYWNKCYDCIRKFYNDTIIIIDDHSTYEPFRVGEELVNAKLIKSDFEPNRGELLPYYYFLTKKFSINTVFLHDTVFIHKPIDENFLYTKFFHFLWKAQHNWDPNDNIIKILSLFKDVNLNNLFVNKKKWDVCFGGMAILNINYLSNVFDSRKMYILLSLINNREMRMVFERIISLILTNKYKKTITINGDIHKSNNFRTRSFVEYLKHTNLLDSQNMHKIILKRKGVMKKI